MVSATRRRGEVIMIDKVTAVIADVDGTINIKSSPLMPRTLAAINARL